MGDQDKIETIEARIDSLPLADPAVTHIVSLLDDPDSNFDRIIERLSPDVAAKFLDMANSAYYGGQVRSINHAVRVLGYSGMKQILITSLLLDHFGRRSDLVGFNFDKFQKQGRLCAVISRLLGQIVDYKKTEELFTVAILHNIGKLVIATYFKDEYKELKALKESQHIGTQEAERKILGFTHAEIGVLVLKKFNMPRDICNAVKYHHTDRIIPEDSNFELEAITREAAKMVDNLRLPEEMEPLEIIDRLQEAVKECKTVYQGVLRPKLRCDGYEAAFSTSLKEVSRLLYTAMGAHFQERVCGDRGEENRSVS